VHGHCLGIWAACQLQKVRDVLENEELREQMTAQLDNQMANFFGVNQRV
jgi:hypothetical protein